MSTSESHGTLAGARILLADDHDDFGQLVRAFLSPMGATVDTVFDGLEALRAGSSMAYDLILIDIQMPEMDGYRVTELLRERGFLRPIIAVTAHAMPPHLERALAAGCDEVHTKPVSLPILKEAICRCLTRTGPRVSAGTCQPSPLH